MFIFFYFHEMFKILRFFQPATVPATVRILSGYCPATVWPL